VEDFLTGFTGMKMRFRCLFLLLTVFSIPLLFAPIRENAYAGPSPTPSCPSCEAFGVQVLENRKDAPPFTLKSSNGTSYSLKDFKGKPVLVLFWATWCPSCCEELPVLDKHFAERQEELVTLLLAIDGEKVKRVQGFIEKSKIKLPVLLDEKEKIARSYGVNFIPAAFLIDREGKIMARIVGERDWSLPVAWSVMKELLSLR
jgi:peroxiredoxin